MAIQRLPCGPLHQNTTVQLAVRKRSLHRWISSTCYLESLMCSELSCCNCINTIRPIIMSNRGGTISTIVYHSHCLSHLSSTQSKYCLWSKQPVLRSVRYCGTKCALRSVRSPISRASRRDDLRRLGSYGRPCFATIACSRTFQCHSQVIDWFWCNGNFDLAGPVVSHHYYRKCKVCNNWAFMKTCIYRTSW